MVIWYEIINLIIWYCEIAQNIAWYLANKARIFVWTCLHPSASSNLVLYFPLKAPAFQQLQ